MIRPFIVLASLLLCSAASAADNPVEGCKNAVEAFADDDLELALEEARWCLEGLEQAKAASAASGFADEVMGYKGGELRNQRAMGMMMLERTYTLDGKSISVSVTSGGAVGNNMLGAALQFGMGGNKVRIRGHTGQDMSSGRTAKLMVTPRKGEGFANIESNDLSFDELVTWAKEFFKEFNF